MNIATFEANCRNHNCQNKFDAPALSDFNYGEFIYCSENGMEIKYYCGLDCKVWSFVDQTVTEFYKKNNSIKIGQIIQKIIGSIADSQNPDLYLTQDIYCPKCNSKCNSINTNIKTGIRDYENLTFHHFNEMTELRKKELIERRIIE